MVKKIIYTLLILLLLGISINFGVKYYANKKLPAILKEQKNFPYAVTYNKLDINIWAGSFSLHDVQLRPKAGAADTLKNTLYASIKEIGVKGFSVWKLLSDNQILANRVEVIQPQAVLYDTKKKYDIKDDIEKPFRQVIQTGSVSIEQGRFRMLDSLKHPTLKVSNVFFTLTNITVDSTSVKKNIPVRYRDYTLKADSLYYRAGKHYNITAAHVAATDTSFTARGFHLLPRQTRKQFVNMVPLENDQFNISASGIQVSSADWGFVRDTFYFHTPQVVISKVNANIYRSKEPNDDPKRKKLYSELLRSLNFDLDVKRLLIKNSDIQYEEQIDFAKPAARVSFSKFYATAANICSTVGRRTLPDTRIDVQCLFMRKAPLSVNWVFNTNNFNDAFTIKGNLQNIHSEDINPVAKPLMNVTTTGMLNDIQFTFNGNRERGSGTFAIKYANLKVAMYKKDGQKKNKLLSAVGNLLVKNDSDNRLAQATPEVIRKKDKSVFNFLWLFVQQGLKETLLADVLQKG